MTTSTPTKVKVLIPQSTPLRDRTQPLRGDPSSSQYSSPTSTRPTNHSTMAASPSATSSAILTVDDLLANYASAPNPPLSALDYVVSDRNSLSSQNAQLWKVIEKQRIGYSQIMKALERVRGERDTYRSKLNSMGENTDALLKSHREKEKREGKDSLRPTASHSHLRPNENASSSSSSTSTPTRGVISRANSDDIGQSHPHMFLLHPSAHYLSFLLKHLESASDS